MTNLTNRKDKIKSSLIRMSALIVCFGTLLSPALVSCTDKPLKPHDYELPKDSQTSGSEHTAKPPKTENNPALLVSEVMIQNKFCHKAPDGNYYPFFELKALKALNLKEYSLVYSDSESYSLPDKTLSAGEYYIVFARPGEFNITPQSSAKLTLMHGELISQSFVYINRNLNCSYDVLSSSESTRPTPGYENALEKDRLTITELMCENTKYPVKGAVGDFVEICNEGESDINLADYFISDKVAEPYLCALPEYTLKSGEYYVLCANKELNFGLSKSGETLTLTRRDGVVSSIISYTSLDKNCSLTGEGVSLTPTPGYPNTDEGRAAYLQEGVKGTLVINEVISSNGKYKKYLSDYHDMVELYNSSAEDINLSGYYLSDKSKNLKRYKLPDVTLKSGGYYIVYCTGDGDSDPDFKISTDGESLFISNEEGEICSFMNVPYLNHNTSYGLKNGKLQYFQTPTFGTANGSGFDKMTAVPSASVSSGEYSSSVKIMLEGAENADIYYTTNGTKPSTSSKKYDGSVITLTKSANLRMFSKAEGEMQSAEVSYSYLIAIPDYSLPVVSVAVDNEEMFGENGVFNTSEKTELDARVTYFVDGKEEFTQGCGIKIFGGMTRFYKKKSFQLKFRGMYGKSSLEYKMFDDLEYSEFNSLVLRAGGQSLTNYLINDELGTSLASTSGNMPTVLVQSFKPTNLYINGEYMGVYYIREKIDDEFVANKLGVSPESVTVINGFKAVKYGKNDAGWANLLKFINEKDLSVKENYEYIKERVDIDSLIDFYTMQMWANNHDTGNFRVARSTENNGKWYFILFDMDLSFDTAYSGAQTYLKEYSYDTKPFNSLIYKLMKNDEFLEYFKARFEGHLATTLSPETINARIDYITSLIAHDMEYEIQRWAAHNSNYNQSISGWNSRIKTLRNRRATETYIERYKKEVYEHIDAIRKK